jgi:hypothetical protein
MSKMPHADWKEWATRRPDWMGQDATSAFEEFIERKWLDALNIAVTEPAPWRGDGEKVAGGTRMPEKASGGGQGAMRLTGAVNVIEREEAPRSPSPQWDLSFRRKCRARNLIGCEGNHMMLQCEKLLSLGLAERRDALEKSGLCMFCSSTRLNWSAMAREAYPSPGARAPDATGSTHLTCTC